MAESLNYATNVRNTQPPTTCSALVYYEGSQRLLEHSVAATAKNFKQVVYPNMPLCMKHVQDKYKVTKCLGYYEMLQLGLYHKASRMTLEDALEHFSEANNVKELERHFRGFYKNDIHPCKCKTIQGYSKLSKNTNSGVKVHVWPWDDLGSFKTNLTQIGITDL